MMQAKRAQHEHIVTNNQEKRAERQLTIQQTSDSSQKSTSDVQQADDKDIDVGFFVNYRGKVTEKFAQSLYKLHAPCKVIMTLRKTKNLISSIAKFSDTPSSWTITW